MQEDNQCFLSIKLLRYEITIVQRILRIFTDAGQEALLFRVEDTRAGVEYKSAESPVARARFFRHGHAVIAHRVGFMPVDVGEIRSDRRGAPVQRPVFQLQSDELALLQRLPAAPRTRIGGSDLAVADARDELVALNKALGKLYNLSCLIPDLDIDAELIR